MPTNPLIDLGLAEQHVFVAGVGSGIGRACVQRVRRPRAPRLVLRHRRRCRAGVGRRDRRCRAARSPATLAASTTCACARRATAEFGPLDVAVDVIGETRWGRTIELSDEAWDESFDLVLRQFFNLARVAGRDLADQGRGAIVAISSVSGLRSAPLHGAYGAAKAGLMSLVRTLAMELGVSGVRVNAVAPARCSHRASRR